MTTREDVVEVFEEYVQAAATMLPNNLYVEKAQPGEQRVPVFKYTAVKKHVWAREAYVGYDHGQCEHGS